MAYEQEHPLINGASNNTTTATQDTLGGGWIYASLSSSTDVDYFKVTTTSAALIKVELNNLLLTATSYWNLSLLDSNGDYVTNLTGSVSGTPVVDGTNTGTSLAVTGLTAAVPVGSRFTFATTSADTTIYTVTSATTLSGGSSTLTLDQSLPSGLPASTALIFDPAQALAAGGLTTVTGQVSAAGTYFVKVSAASWNDAEYSVRARILPTVESTGDNNTKSAAVPSSTTNENRPLENAWMAGNLSSATDTDFWVFSTASMAGDIKIDFAAATGDNNTPEWEVKLSQWTGDQPLTTVQGVAISATAGASKTFTVESAKYGSATTYVVEIAKASGVTVDTGTYKLRVRGDTLDLNDTPVVTIDSVTSTRPYAVVDTGVSRSVKAATGSSASEVAASKVALSTLFSVSDADAGQTIDSYKLALSKATGETGSVSGSIALIDTSGTTTYPMSSTVTLTAAQMAKAYLLPGTVTGNLSLALQAFDSSGALDNSGASSVMLQTLRVVSSAVGVNATNDGSLSLVEGSSGSSEILSFSLATAPTQDVKVYLEQDSNNRFSFSSSVLTFTSSNFGTAQTVTVTARDNQATEGAHTGQINFRVVSLDSQYDGYSITPLTVAIADPANNLPTGSVVIDDTTPTQDQTLTVSNTLADADGPGTIAASYQWQSSTNGTTWSDLSTGSTLAITEALVGKQLKVVASYTDLLGHAESKASDATTPVANVNDPPTGAVTIGGTAIQGQTLTAANTLADADGLGTITYQWKADSTAISGATASTFVITSAEVGKAVTVTASYTDGHSTGESANSLAMIPGGAGDDALQGTSSADTIYAGMGADKIVANAGDDSVYLAADATWSSGVMILNTGSPGVAGTNETLSLGNLNRYTDVADGGQGTDTIQLTTGDDAFFLHDAFSAFNANVTLASESSQRSSAQRQVSIENIQTGSGDDVVDLTSLDYSFGAVTLDGGAGNDILWSNAGSDSLIGGTGNDTLFGGAGNDTLNGGDGNDVFQFVGLGGGQDTIADFTPGSDKIRLFGAANVSEVQIAVASDHVTLTWGAAVITLTGITSSTGSATWFQIG